MDREDISPVDLTGVTDFNWGIRGGHWRKEKSSRDGSTKLDDDRILLKESLPALSHDVRWIVLENLWAFESPPNEPERSWWISERHRRLSVEMDRDPDVSRAHNCALKCFAACPEDKLMRECWNKFISVTSMTYKDLLSLMSSFNRRRLPKSMKEKKKKSDSHKRDCSCDECCRPWWSFCGFYGSGLMKTAVLDEWEKRRDEHRDGVNIQHDKNNRKQWSAELKMLSNLKSYSDHHKLKDSFESDQLIDKYDQRFVPDVKALFFCIDPLLAKKVWTALCPVHRPTELLRSSLEVALSSCSNKASRESQELRRSIGASLQTIDTIYENRKRCLLN